MISYNSTTNQVTFTDTILNPAIATINTYTTATIAVKNLETNGTITTNLISTPSAYVLPNLLTNIIFGLTGTNKPTSGIYQFVITLTISGITTTETQCLLVDSGIICDLKNDTEKFIKYLILKETYWCTCECDKLYTIYKSLTKNINGIEDCNC